MKIQTQAEQYPHRVALFQRSALTDEEKAELARQFHEEGGYTFRHHPGDGPTDGFMVSLPDAEEISPADEFNANKAGDFHERREPLLQSHKDNYDGNWNDREHNNAYQDVSRHLTDLWDAVAQGRGKNDAEAQHGIYHLPSGVTFSPLEFSYNGTPGFTMARRRAG